MADMKLKSCPVCASTNVRTGDDYRSDPCVRCCTCGLQTSGYDSAQEAIKIWNTRAESEEIKELRAALEFYSVNKNYENQPMGSQWSMDGGMAYRLSEIMQDKGKIAQVALTSIKE